MAYTDAQTDRATQATGILTTVAIHALLAAGVIAGLTITGAIADEEGDFISIFVPEEVPPPPPDPIEPPSNEMPTPQPPTAPVPPIELPSRSPVLVEPTREIRDIVVPIPVPPRPMPTSSATAIPTPTPSPAPSFAPAPPVPRNGPAGWITNNDYPNSDLRRENEGTAGYRLVVGSDGRVDACEITSSTGHSSLDSLTCRLLSRRARFEPATNSAGADVVGTFSGSVAWQIPD